MKASKILERYASGERNFPKVILRGCSFKGQDLTGVNFSDADIRGADFSGAILVGANFSHAKAGLQRRWAIFLVLVSWVLMCLSGFLSAFAGVLIFVLILLRDEYQSYAYQVVDRTSIVILVIFFCVTIRQGIQAGLGARAVARAFVGAFAVAYAVAGSYAFLVVTAKYGAAVFVIARAGTFAFAGTFAGASAVAYAGARYGAFAVAFVVAGAFDVVGAYFGASAFAGTFAFFGGSVTFAVAFAVILFSIYRSWRALDFSENESTTLVQLGLIPNFWRCLLKGDPKHALIRNIAVAFAAFKGTNFRSANLTDADFTQATLKNTDLRKANLTRTCFHKTKKPFL
ncbi:pentapeptide repeat-containing protein [Nostoc sp.]|uniref:pentapeptide repeat-containing protein n=1 Tax=Nostoc sp. TaxID=1180 RepID=UPI002FFB1FFE